MQLSERARARDMSSDEENDVLSGIETIYIL